MKQHLLSVGVFLLALFFSMSLLGRLQRKPRQSKLLTAMALADKHGGAEATGSKKGAPAAVPDAAAQAAAARKAKYAHLSVPGVQSHWRNQQLARASLCDEDRALISSAMRRRHVRAARDATASSL